MTALDPPVAQPALGTTAVVLVADHDGDALAAAQAVAVADPAYRRFQDDVELAQLSAAGGATITASPVLLDTLAVTWRAARLNDGAVLRTPPGRPRS